MKSRVVFMALLCLLLIFTGAYAEQSVKTNLVYTGEPQELVSDPQSGYLYGIDGDPSGFHASAPTKTDVGEYRIVYKTSATANPQTLGTAKIGKAPVTVTFTIDGIEVSGDKKIVFDNAEHPINFTAKTDYEENVFDKLKWTYTKDGKPESNSPKDAAEYVLSVSLKEDSVNYTLDPAPSQKLTITPAEVNVTWMVDDTVVQENSKTLVYDGRGHSITYTAVDGDGKDVKDQLEISGSKDGEPLSGSIKSAGTYKASIKVKEEVKNNYKLSDSYKDFTLTIGKAPVTVTFTIDGKEVSGDKKIVFDNAEHPIDFTAKTDYEDDVRSSLTWTYTKDGKTETNSPKDAAEYVLSVSLKEDTVNYTLDPAPSQKLTITPAEVNVTWMVDDTVVQENSKTLVYDGREHAITFTATLNDEKKTVVPEGNFTLSIKKDGETYGGAIFPAGIYTASAVKSEEVKNYKLSDSYKDFTLTIGKAPVTVTFTIDGKEVSGDKKIVFDNAEHPINFTAKTDYEDDVLDKLKWTYTKDGKPESNSPKDAAEYVLSVSLKEDSVNYTLDPAPSQKLTITPAEVNVTWMVDDTVVQENSKTLVYDGREHSITYTAVDGDGKDVKRQLEISGSKDGEPLSGSIKSAGTYKASITVKEEVKNNYKLSDSYKDFTLTIGKAPVTVTFTIDGKEVSGDQKIVFNNAEHPIDFTAKTEYEDDVRSSLTWTYTKNGKTETNSPKDVAEYILSVTLSENASNYTLDPAPSQKLTITQTEVTVTIRGVSNHTQYDGEVHGAWWEFVNAKINGEVTELYTKDDFAPVEGKKVTIAEKNAGLYTLTLTADMFEDTSKTGNFTVKFVFDPAEFELEITKKPVTLTWDSNKVFNYDGKEHGPSAAKITIEELVNDEEQAKVATITVKDSPNVNAGTYTAKAEVSFNPANYELAQEPKTDEFTYTITKATLTVAPAPALKSQDLPYTGRHQELLASLGGLTCGSNENPCPGNIIYVINNQWPTNPDENPMAKEVGDYTITYYVTNYDTNNYQCAYTKDSPYKIPYVIRILPAAATLTWYVDETTVTGNSQTISYDGSGHTISFKAAVGDTDITDKMVLTIKKGTETVNNPLSQTGKYTATVTVSPEETGNFNLEGQTTEFTLTINAIDAQITFGTETTHEYDGTNWLPEIIVKETSSGNVVKDPKLETSVTVRDSENGYPNVGKYTLTVKNLDPNMNANDASVDFEITKADYVDNSASGDVTEPNSFAVLPIDGLTYNGAYQTLVNVVWSENTNGTVYFAVIDEYGEQIIEEKAITDLDPDAFLEAAVAKNVGTYKVYYYVKGDKNHNDFMADAPFAGPVIGTITEADLSNADITLNPAVLPYTGDPVTANPTVTYNGVTLVPGVDYEITGNVATEVGTYTLTITAVPGSRFIGTVNVAWEIKDMVNRISMFRIGEPDKVCLRCGVLGGELPATGFPTRVNVPLAVKPQGLDYAELGMRIQIPSLNVDVELAGVPTMDGAWKVEWLADRAGLLSGTALPGDGYSIVAAHNTLNAEEVGPFVLLSTLQDNDTIFVNAPDGSMKLFRVYANELLAPNDMETLASIAEQESNTLVLVTCENESVDGGYLNRRVVFAKPLN